MPITQGINPYGGYDPSYDPGIVAPTVPRKQHHYIRDLVVGGLAVGAAAAFMRKDMVRSAASYAKAGRMSHSITGPGGKLLLGAGAASMAAYGLLGIHPMEAVHGRPLVKGGMLGAAASDIDLLYGIPGLGGSISNDIIRSQWQRATGPSNERASLMNMSNSPYTNPNLNATGDLVFALRSLRRGG